LISQTTAKVEQKQIKGSEYYKNKIILYILLFTYLLPYGIDIGNRHKCERKVEKNNLKIKILELAKTLNKK
jgi:hypothetical protein